VLAGVTHPSYFESTSLACHAADCGGVKDSSGDMNYFQKIVAVAKQRSDFTVLVGPESLMLDAIAAGGHGGVHRGANICPGLIVTLYDTAVNGKNTDALQEHLRSLGRIYSIGSNPVSSAIKAIKCSLSVLGICSDRMSQPFTAFTAHERAQVERIIGSVMQQQAVVGR